jgi:hypothetical protein
LLQTRLNHAADASCCLPFTYSLPGRISEPLTATALSSTQLLLHLLLLLLAVVLHHPLQPVQRIFEPPKVPVFCLCEMPYNPDKFMVQCDHCTEW